MKASVMNLNAGFFLGAKVVIVVILYYGVIILSALYAGNLS